MWMGGAEVRVLGAAARAGSWPGSRAGFLAAALLLPAAAAWAQSAPAPVSTPASGPVSGPYVNLGLGGNVLNRVGDAVSLPEFGITSGAGGYGDTAAIGSKGGFIGSAAVGYGLGQGLRLEIEGDYRRNELTSLGGLRGGGEVEQAFGFANALWDFPGIGNMISPGLSPFVGVGAGYEYTHFLNASGTGDDGFGNTVTLRSNGSNGSFAAQAMVGLAYDITAIPGLSVTAEYRFSATTDQHDVNGQFSAPGISTRATIHTDNFFDHAGLIGLRYAFFPGSTPQAPAAAPAAAPPPAPAAMRTYLVFFDWDRADLSPRARQIVAEAAGNAGHIPTTRIEVSGYTDLSGTAAYNKKLSLRRAEAVRVELVRDGVPASDIAVFGLGEDNPLVPTAAGVREPQNRRVEIILK